MVGSTSELVKQYFKELLSDGEPHSYKEMCEYADCRFEDEKSKYSYLNVEFLSNGVKARASMNLINKEMGEIRYTKVKDGIYKQYKYDVQNDNKAVKAVIELKDSFLKRLRKELYKYNKIDNEKLTKDEFNAIQELKNIIQKLEN